MINMKRQLKYIAIAFVTVLWSCELDGDTEGISRITYFPDFDYKGASVMLAPCGSPVADPGVTAKENGAALEVTTTISAFISGGSVPSVPGTADRYTFAYKATNKDGFPANTSRVIWEACTGNLTTSIEGLYTSTVFRDGISGAQYTNMKYLLIRKKPGSTNVYQVSDAIGGWYQLGRALGDAYNAPGLEVTATNIPANSFTFGGNPRVLTFGGPVAPQSLTVDAATKTLVLTSKWDNGAGTIYTFVATLKQVSI
jgi:hypothetical protein